MGSRLGLRLHGRQGGDVVIYLDGFSDRDDNPLAVPDYIFFGAEDHVDLSESYGDKAKEYKNIDPVAREQYQIASHYSRNCSGSSQVRDTGCGV